MGDEGDGTTASDHDGSAHAGEQPDCEQPDGTTDGWRRPIELTPIGVVRSPRTEAIDDDWAAIASTIELDADRFGPEVVAGLDGFSHVEVVFVFHGVDEATVHLGARHPRGRRDWPAVGILAQRAKARPNRLGVTVCPLDGVDGLTLSVRGLDAIDGTPVLDVKPYLAEFAPRGATRQPAWATELMRDYWEIGAPPT